MQGLLKVKTEECDKLNQELVRVSEAHRASEASLRLTMTKQESAVSAARQDLAEVRGPAIRRNRAHEYECYFDTRQDEASKLCLFPCMRGVFMDQSRWVRFCAARQSFQK